VPRGRCLGRSASPPAADLARFAHSSPVAPAPCRSGQVQDRKSGCARPRRPAPALGSREPDLLTIFEPAWEECWHHLLKDGENCVVDDRHTLKDILAHHAMTRSGLTVSQTTLHAWCGRILGRKACRKCSPGLGTAGRGCARTQSLRGQPCDATHDGTGISAC
jgi:hypothetical protein